MADASTPDFLFHWDGGSAEWDHLRVVSWELEDALSACYQLKLVLRAKTVDDEIDPEALIGKLGTLRIHTLSDPAVRVLHGLVIEAAEIGSSQSGMLYELVLAPPLVRAAHRVTSRIFLEKTTKQILEAVLTGDPQMKADDPKPEQPDSMTDAFAAPAEAFAFRVQDPARIDDAKTRPFCVQYNESNLDFIARLLAEEGLSFHFEHHKAAIVLVISDGDAGRTKLDPFDPIGPGVLGRQVDQVRLGGRLRATRFRLNDFNPVKPKLDMKVEAKADGDGSLAIDHFPGLYPDEPKQGELLAKARLERLQTEARFAQVDTPCRLLGAGHVFALSHPTPRYEGEYLVTRARLRGHVPGELGPGERLPARFATDDARPFSATLECARRGTHDAPDESKFRPALCPKPRIIGAQTALVTAEPSNKDAEIHVGGPEGNENGCVRLKFHWDLETERHDKEPTSCWVRVSQAFAGAGGGALCHPRVGTEVIVDFQDGDPDRPIVVGRVYNGEQPAPALGKGAATVTTLKSLASPGGKVFNELAFDDTAGEEKVNLTAGKDWNTQVGNNRDEKVKNDSSSTVDVNRKEDTGSNRTTHVGGSNEESVDGSEKVTVSGDQEVSVGGSQKVGIGADRSLTVGASQTTSVGASNSVSVGASESYSVAASRTDAIGAALTQTVGANATVTVAAAATLNAGASHTVNTPVSTLNAGATASVNTAAFAVNASGSATISTTDLKALAAGPFTINGATITIKSGGEVMIEGASVHIKGGTLALEGGAVTIAGGTVDITGGAVNVN